MKTSHLNLQTVLAVAAMLKDQFGRTAVLGQLGIAEDAFRVFISDAIWTRADRTAVTRTMQSLRDGFAEVSGHIPFNVPAEYVAGLIVHFTHQVNWSTACAWFAAATVPSSELAAGEGGVNTPVTAQQLYALCLECLAHPDGFAAYHDAAVAKAQDVATRKQKPQAESNARA